MRGLLVGPLEIWFLVTAIVISACSAQSKPEPPQAPARAPDRFIYVSAGEVPSVCYHELGSVSFEEPYTDAAMDGDGVRMATKLRQLAMAKYPDTADAVINVRLQENDVGTIVTITGEAVELQQGQHTVECAMRKAPGVLNTAAAVAAGGLLGAAAGGLIPGAGTTGMMGGAAVGLGAVGTYMAVKQHRETKHEQAELKKELAEQRSEIAHLLAKRSSMQKCADEETPLANCKIDETIAAADADPPPDAPSYEQEQPEFDVQRQIQEQQGYIQKLRDQVFELQQQLGGYASGTH